MGAGYKTILQKDHPHTNSGGHILEHIVIAEQKLGRPLKDGEVVHHIDGNKLNNNPNNLIVFATTSDHTSFHGGHEIYKDGDVWRAIHEKEKCKICGKEFILSASKRKHKTRYCSIACKMLAETKVKDLNVIINTVNEENGNFTKAAKRLDVTDNALKHRLKRAGMPFHSKDYKRN